MKNWMISLVAIASISTFSFASRADVPAKGTPGDQLCRSFEEQYDTQCAHIMCDDLIKDGTFTSLEDCTSASDYGEAAQASCEDIPQIEDLLADYNQAHPGVNLECY